MDVLRAVDANCQADGVDPESLLDFSRCGVWTGFFRIPWEVSDK